VVKEGALLLLSADNGDIEEHTDQGLYFHDMRYLSACTLHLNGHQPVVLLADAGEGNHETFELTNLDIRDEYGEVRLPKEMLSIRRHRALGDDCTESISVENYARRPADITLRLHYAADFADMFVIRGMHPGRRGVLHPPRWDDKGLNFRYDGADGCARGTSLRFSHVPDARDECELTYNLHLDRHERWELTICCEVQHGGRDGLESLPSQTGGVSAGQRQLGHPNAVRK
jgi:glycogen debranching enzyme